MNHIPYYLLILNAFASCNAMDSIRLKELNKAVHIHEYDPTDLKRLKTKLNLIIATKKGLNQDIRMFVPDKFKQEIGSILLVSPLFIALHAGFYKKADQLLALMDLSKSDTYDQMQYKYPILYLLNFVLPSDNHSYLNAVLLDHGASIKNTEKARMQRMKSKYSAYPNGTSYLEGNTSYFKLKAGFENQTIKTQQILLFSQDY